MNAKQEAVRQEARQHLADIKPGDTIYSIIRTVSRSGMSRKIDLLQIKEYGPSWLTFWTATLLDGKKPERKHADNGEGMRVNGCGMDMAEHLVRSLAYALFGDEEALNHRRL